MTRIEQVATWASGALFCLNVGYGGAAVHVLPEPWRGGIGWGLAAASGVAAAMFAVLAVRAGWWARGRHR